MESRTSYARPYPMLHKAKAFMRGLPSSPLVEVAREGIRNKLSLSQLQEFRYANKLAEHGTSRFLCEVLGRGCSKTVQDIFAASLRSRFEEKLRFMAAISYALWEEGHDFPTFCEACRWDALKIAGLRKNLSGVLASGKITSALAQAELVPILRHYNIVDCHFEGRIAGLSGHETAVLSSPNAPDELKKLVIREMADSRSIACKGMLGLPLTPYDQM